jgi:hypothetical protein
MAISKGGLTRVIGKVDPEKLEIHALLMANFRSVLNVNTKAIEALPYEVDNFVSGHHGKYAYFSLLT